MKILVSCFSKSWGGMEMYALTTMRYLQKRGIEVHLLCFPESTLHHEATEHNFRIITSTAVSPVHLFGLLKLARHLRREEYDLIHTHASKDLWALTPALQVARLKIPLFLTKHVGSYISKKDLLHRWMYSRVTTAFAISTVIAKNLLDTCPLTPDRIVLLHDGIDLERFSAEKADAAAARKELGIKPDELVLGMTTRFSPGKGHEEFLQAMAGLRSEFPKARGIIVGEASYGEQAYAQKIHNMARELKLDNIIFTGYRKDTERMYAAMDVFVFPSHSEAFGMALVEAMAMGKPSVCSNSDGVPDIAVDNETSLLFAKQDAADLESKLRRLLRDPHMRWVFAENAGKRARSMFDIEILTDRVIAIYKSALQFSEIQK
jgi:glycosyltransferase involved in cell wall biosynthesis